MSRRPGIPNQTLTRVHPAKGIFASQGMTFEKFMKVKKYGICKQQGTCYLRNLITLQDDEAGKDDVTVWIIHGSLAARVPEQSIMRSLPQKKSSE